MVKGAPLLFADERKGVGKQDSRSVEKAWKNVAKEERFVGVVKS